MGVRNKKTKMQNQGNGTSAMTTGEAVKAATAAVGRAAQNDFVQKIVDKIKGSENILIALSRDPSVDEIAAAIGLALFLDGMQKHATAIYSGRTPDELAFLQPGETFERTTDSLQDFIISLNKEKADHLRYKLEGDFVKVFITPYKAKITEEDLTFSHGDYNVDFVIAINVASVANLDEALREHGRIMHDASAVNITTGEPGRFGEIEWSNPVASSLCEMITDLIFALQGSDEKPLDGDIATALLTGIVAATDRFSNNRTNPDTLGIASKLMTMGADQQLITSNIHGNDRVKNVPGQSKLEEVKKPKELGAMEVDHEEEKASDANAAGNGAGVPSGAGNVAGSGGVTSGTFGVPGMVNPAAQMAPSAGGNGSPTPTAVNGTNSATPESVIVQPVIPGTGNTLVLPGMNGNANGAVGAGNVNSAATANAAGAANAGVANPSEMRLPGVNMPNVNSGAVNAGAVANAAGGANGSRSMATSEPTLPEEKPVGMAIQPPVVEPKKPKNYAEMMEEALAEPIPGLPQEVPQMSTMDILTAQPGVQNDGTANAVAGNGGTAEAAVAGQTPAASEPIPVMGTGIGIPPVMEMAMNQGNAGAGAPAANGAGAVPAMEPVANPNNGAVLPPPPAPNVTPGMMPPVLPPVQLPTDITG